ncbi:Major facilitator family transporter [Pseudomonas sp. OF001]|uniref:MFS transporter n=1 Tax=Pseudomonas sp. OF001 TaxID=2772300 RepID=UPI001918517A|nr:MFS transporter [Pseudomonas sp. OF001]CAD5375872.1 Major facilitator family transporter [Pseudomonas sp. OF001]
MRWATYCAVTGAVVLVGLALGLSLPLVSLRLDAWGYGQFAIGVMAAMPALGVLLGARLTHAFAALCGTPRSLQLSLLLSALSVAALALWPDYGLWLLLRLLLGVSLTVVFVLGESWINQLASDAWRGRLVALYGTGFALSQLCGPLLLGVLGSAGDQALWLAAALLVAGCLLLLGRGGAPQVGHQALAGGGLAAFCRGQPAIAWAVVLFAAFDALALTLLPVYLLHEGIAQGRALHMLGALVLGNALLQLPLGLLADRLPRPALLRACGLLLLASSLALPLALHSPLVWLLLPLLGASAGGLYTLALVLVGARYRDDALVRANAHIALLWGTGCLLGPLSTGAASQWLSGHGLPLLLAGGAALFLVLALRRGAFELRGDAG